MSTTEELIGLRKSAEEAGLNVGWDANTGNVRIGENTFSPQQLQAMGGQLQNDSWMMPQGIVQGLTGRGASTPSINIDDISRYYQEMSGGYLQQQQAMAEQVYNNNIAMLEMALNQAVSEGQISVREAEKQFQEQSKVIEEQVYRDAEMTKLYGQDMGIQHSQQMIGLMQGDMARKTSLINKNMTERDIRINTIRDRLNSIKAEHDIEKVRYGSELGSSLMSATGQAQMMYGQAMGDLMSQDYARQQEYFNQEKIQRLIGQQRLDELDVSHEHRLTELGQEQVYKLDQMLTQHGYNVEMFDMQATQSMKELAERYRLEGILSAQQASAQLKIANAKISAENKRIEEERKDELERAKREYLDPNSDEYKIRVAKIEEASTMKARDAITSTVAEFELGAIFTNEYLDMKIEEPKTGFIQNMLHPPSYHTKKREQYEKDAEEKRKAEEARDRLLKQYGIGVLK